ncbi:hypothetical protein BC828DRAFT_402662 [Blastocladiella britannica]|nr:hypothetical protein BC828DRAFT_402662 [Blastocladiella britannica]
MRNLAGFYTAILDPAVRALRVPPSIVHRAAAQVPIPTSIVPPIHKDDSIALKYAHPRPIAPPPPEDCCMAGCVHCVWTLYADEFVQHRRALRTWHANRYQWATELLKDQPQQIKIQLKQQMEEDRVGMAEPNSESEERRAALAGMDPAVRVFWEMEQRTKPSGK